MAASFGLELESNGPGVLLQPNMEDSGPGMDRSPTFPHRWLNLVYLQDGFGLRVCVHFVYTSEYPSGDSELMNATVM